MSDVSEAKFWIKFADEYPPEGVTVRLTDDGFTVKAGSWAGFDDEGHHEWKTNGDYYDGDRDEFDAPYIYWAHIPARTRCTRFARLGRMTLPGEEG